MSDICFRSLVKYVSRGNQFAAVQLLGVRPITSPTARSIADLTDEERELAMKLIRRIAICGA